MECGTECCGLLTFEKLPIPLQGISVDVQVRGFVADVSATLKYKNKEEKAVEAIFIFPVDEDSAVYSFEATIEGRKITADLQEKEQAHLTYDEAISQGQEAFLLEEDQSSGDIFSCTVGNLPPGQDAEVKFSFVQELPVTADGAVRFVLPAVLNPRYTPKGKDPSITATLPQVPASALPYTLSLDASFHSSYGICKIESPCDLTPIQYTNEDKTAAKVSLAEGHKFDRDVELLVYYQEVNKPSVTLESGLPGAEAGSFMADPIAMLSFYPNIPESQEQSNCGEFIFVVDRSGSMECPMNYDSNSTQRIQSAKETLVLLLKSLPLGCFFNIYGFGSHFEAFFPESMEYTQETLDGAIEKVNEMSADFGGTEILEPLQKIYKTAGRPAHPRQVFIFTDGEVGNTKDVIAEVQRNAPNHRCFTFGIGEGASTALIKGVARAANGTYDFITGKDRLQPKVLKALKYALQPTVMEISLNWTLPSDMEANLVSDPPTAIFQGQRSIIYAQLKGKLEEDKEAQVSLQYKFKDEIINNVLSFPLKGETAERPTIHRLAAKSLISKLESDSESEDVKKRIQETSLQSGVLSSLTAYVAVNRDTKTKLEGPPVTRISPPVMMACRMAAPPIAMCYSASLPMPDMVHGIEYLMQPESVEFLADAEPQDIDLQITQPVLPDVQEIPAENLTPETAESPALLKLIDLQKADGSWNATPELAAILGISGDLAETRPHLDMDSSAWATILAVIWLHSSSLDQREEWELLEGKAISWLKSRAGLFLADAVQAGNQLLNSSVELSVFGL